MASAMELTKYISSSFTKALASLAHSVLMLSRARSALMMLHKASALNLTFLNIPEPQTLSPVIALSRTVDACQ